MRLIRSVLLPVFAISATFLVLWYSQRPVPVSQSNMGQVRQEAQRGNYRLIDAESLWKIYQTSRDKILLVDTRQEWEHRSGYIDGSSNFPMEPSWRARWFRRGDLKTFLGPDLEKTIIFY